jgi:hypothetical protein
LGIGFVAAVQGIAAGGIDESCDGHDLTLIPASAVERQARFVRFYVQELLLGGIR